MTPESRILETIHSARSNSAWSPMPEHLLFLQMNRDKADIPKTPDTTINICECGMTFKTEAMLTYHKVGFCVGKPTEERPPSPFELTSEETIMMKAETKTGDYPVKDKLDTTTAAKKSSQESTQRQSKLEWCAGSNGTVPPSAVKVGFDEHDQAHTYVCLAQVGEAVIPGTVLPFRKHATVTLDGEEFIVKEYNVLTDLSGHVTWKRCDVIGAIPRGAVKGGYDNKGHQYFIARCKASDGTYCCGQYIPHKQKCCFAWEGSELETKDFEFLCKAYPDRFIKLTSQKENVSENADVMPRQLASAGTELIIKEGNKTPRTTSRTISREKSSTKTETLDMSRSVTGTVGADEKNKESSRNPTQVPGLGNKQGTGGIKQTPGKQLTKLGTGIVTKDKAKPKEVLLTKSGSNMKSKIKNDSRANSDVRTRNTNIQF